MSYEHNRIVADVQNVWLGRSGVPEWTDVGSHRWPWISMDGYGSILLNLFQFHIRIKDVASACQGISGKLGSEGEIFRTWKCKIGNKTDPRSTGFFECCGMLRFYKRISGKRAFGEIKKLACFNLAKCNYVPPTVDPRGFNPQHERSTNYITLCWNEPPPQTVVVGSWNSKDDPRIWSKHMRSARTSCPSCRAGWPGGSNLFG